MIRTIRAHSVLLFCAFLFWLPAIASAGGGTTEVNDVLVTATSDWTTGQLKGYQPLRLELVNKSNSPRSVSISLESDYGGGDVVAQRFSLDAKGRLTAEMVVPTFALTGLKRFAREYSLRAISGSDIGHISSVAGSAGGARRSAMVFTRSRLEAGRREIWESQILGLFGPDAEESEEDDRAAVRGTLLAAGGPSVVLSLGASLFEHLPSKHEAYSSLDCVIIDLSKGAPPFKQLEPILAYVRLGGKAAFLGEGALLKAAQHELLAPLLEERFRENTTLFDATGFELRSCGLGMLLVAETTVGLFDQANVQAAVKSMMFDQRTFVPSDHDRHFPGVRIPGVGKLPYKVFVVLLVLFAILIGPINFVLVRKSGKPALLLLTIPAISIVASLLLIGYGVLYQGLDTKSSSITLAILDQRSERIDVIEDRHCFVGLATESGLKPAAGTACFPVTISDEDARFSVNVGESYVLSSAFYQSRQDMHHRLLSERTSRLRLVVEKSGEGLRVTNGFTSTLSGLSLRDERGRGWIFEGAIGQGDTVELELVSSSSDVFARETVFSQQFSGGGFSKNDGLFPGTYCAHLEENIFQDACGLEMNELEGRHGLVGILDLGDFR